MYFIESVLDNCFYGVGNGINIGESRVFRSGIKPNDAASELRRHARFSDAKPYPYSNINTCGISDSRR